MDFDNVLSIASQNRGTSNASKRYSLEVGPAKKDPKVKGVNSAAVQDFLKKRQMQSKKKEMEIKKQKDELLAKRVELKSDRKARAMASRTKDNFRGYNGIPVVEEPKKRRSKGEREEEKRMETYDPDDEDNYDYIQTDSESEPEPEPVRPSKASSGSGSCTKPTVKKSGGPPKPAPPPMKFTDLLKLAQQKQFEPVELKTKPVKSEHRLRTAEEIRELEIERKAKRPDKGRDSRPERDVDREKTNSSTSSSRKSTFEKDHRNGKPLKSSSDRPSVPNMSKKPRLSSSSDKGHTSSRPSHIDRDRPKTSSSSSSDALSSKVPSKGASSQVSAKQSAPRPSLGHRPSTTCDLNSKKGNSSLPQGRPGGSSGTQPPRTSGMGQRPHQGGSGLPRPSQGSSLKGGPTDRGPKPGKGEPPRSVGNSMMKSGNNGQMRPSSGGPPKPGGQPQARAGGTLQAKSSGPSQVRPGGNSLQVRGGGIRPPGSGPSLTGSRGAMPGRPAGSMNSGPGRPKCTVVSETISSKNFGHRPGAPPGMPQRPGMAPRPGLPPRPMNRPPGPTLPPITSAYKRKYEDEEDEFDSEMEDFIDEDGGDEVDYSKAIGAIFNYDRTKYKEESDYALRFMESSWKDMQKEEARSLRMAVQEDDEEEKREAEEMNRKNCKRTK